MFNDILNEGKGFKYQITLKSLLKKYKLDGEIGFKLVYFNSVTKNNNKSQVQIREIFSRNFIHD